MAKAVRKAGRYCLSFTAAGLKPELSAVIARIHAETGNWKETRALVLERNALQTRSIASAKRLETELRQRLQLLNDEQLKLLAEGSSDDRLAMAWLAVLMQSVGFNPEPFTRRGKLLTLIRLIPFCERNYNLLELGPKGTGKSHVYAEFSPHGMLISGS